MAREMLLSHQMACAASTGHFTAVLTIHTGAGPSPPAHPPGCCGRGLDERGCPGISTCALTSKTWTASTSCPGWPMGQVEPAACLPTCSLAPPPTCLPLAPPGWVSRQVALVLLWPEDLGPHCARVGWRKLLQPPGGWAPSASATTQAWCPPV